MAIAVLISGGVDSAVVVHRLREQGEDLHLFYIRIGMKDGRGDCSADDDIELCQMIAARYGLPLDVVDLQTEYWDNVMEYALNEVRAGRTPNPDMMCNRMIKFGYFEQRWGNKFDMTATGHYATTTVIDGVKYLSTAVDAVKDQTDFLAQITEAQLAHLMFPIGDLPKEEVRRLAMEARLPNATRRDSQGICFLGQIDYNDFLRRELGEREGDIIDVESGKTLGKHHGYWFHTIGQRKGLGLSGGPWYVVGKDVEANIVWVSGGYGTVRQYGRQLRLRDLHAISRAPWQASDGPMAVTFKNRHTPSFISGTLRRTGADEWLLESEADVQGIAPGQFAVIYDRERRLCYGSGVIF